MSSSPLLQIQTIPFKLHSAIQTEAVILSITAYQFQTSKLIFYYLFNFLTLGSFWLLGRWNSKWYLKMKAKISSVDNADLLLIQAQDGTLNIVKPYNININESQYIAMQFRHYNYFYDSIEFQPIETKFHQLTHSQIIEQFHAGIMNSDVEKIKSKYGTNNTEIPDKGKIKTLIDEVLTPFYLFQICSVFLWFFSDYMKYATVILLTSIISAGIAFFEQRTSFKRLQKLAKFEIPVKVIRNQQATKIDDTNQLVCNDHLKFVEISSNDLVPGDIIQLQDSITLPCDCALLTGQCIVNESMLTGESIPVMKTPIPNNKVSFNTADESKQFTLYAGTFCMESRTKQDQHVLALVVQTGFNTMKGQLIRTIMYPQPTNFKFYADSMKFVMVMASFAIIGFFITIPSKIGYLRDGTISTWDFISEGLDLITITVPPALPTCLQIGISIALSRLKDKGIFCISPQKVNVSGKITIMCFDKTGTLTEDGLDLYGIKPNDENFSKVFKDCKSMMNNTEDTKLDIREHIVQVMSCCHSLAWVRGELIGDPLEIKMFNATNSTLKDEIVVINNQETQIIKRFEFSSKLQRMSIIAKKNGKYLSYVKGSPEKIRSLCKSTPSNFHKVLDMHAQQGFRILALGYRELDGITQDRDLVENDLTFLGFLIMENKLKPITEEIIEQLHEARIRSIMVTGDNVLTAISVARQCNLIHYHQRVYLGELSEKKLQNGLYKIQWKDFDKNSSILDPNSLEPTDINFKETVVQLVSSQQQVNSSLREEPPPKLFIDSEEESVQEEEVLPWENDESNYVIALSGGAFTHLVQNRQDLLKIVLKKAQVYARMRPSEKAQLMKELQKMEREPLIGFCGDGANDCGALKAADVGISLSPAEASIAAPFTSNIQDISCIPIIIRQGRAALVTSFACFKYMALYSMIQFSQVTILYLKSSNLTDNQYLYNDLITIFPLSMTMGFTHPNKYLNRYLPGSSLISKPVLFSVIGQTILVIGFQLAVYFTLIQQSWFISSAEANKFDLNDNSLQVCYENTSLFLFGNFQYIAVVLAFSQGKPFRRPFITNLPFMISVLSLLALDIYLLFWHIHWSDQLLGLRTDVVWEGKVVSRMPYSWIWFIGLMTLVYSLCSNLYERFFIPKKNQVIPEKH